MAQQVPHIPEGYRSITPYLIVKDGAQVIEFYKKVFGAREKMRMNAPGGKIGHAELAIGDSMVMLADENPEHNARARRVRRLAGDAAMAAVLIMAMIATPARASIRPAV